MDCFEFDGCKLGYLPAFVSELTTQKTIASRRFNKDLSYFWGVTVGPLAGMELTGMRSKQTFC